MTINIFNSYIPVWLLVRYLMPKTESLWRLAKYWIFANSECFSISGLKLQICNDMTSFSILLFVLLKNAPELQTVNNSIYKPFLVCGILTKLRRYLAGPLDYQICIKIKECGTPFGNHWFRVWDLEYFKERKNQHD